MPKKTKAKDSDSAKSKDAEDKKSKKNATKSKSVAESSSAIAAEGQGKKDATSKTANSKKEKSDSKNKNQESSTKSQDAKSQKPKADSQSDDMTMEELLDAMDYELKAPRKGDVVSGTITDINRRMVLVDIGGKTEGMVVDQEFDATKDLIGDLEIGDSVEVYVSAAENDRGQILLSLKKAAVDRKWTQFEEYLETGKKVSVTGLEVNRGGMIVMAEGLRGFVPSSQFGTEYLGNMDALLDKSFDVKVIEVDKPKNRLIFSEREVSEAEAIELKSKALDVVEVGETYDGVVSGIMPFGAFVTVNVPLSEEAGDDDDDKGQIEGLVHISEISWEKVNDPNDYFTQGDKVEVKVLGIDSGKLNLSVKQLSGDPWDSILDKYEVGTTVSGKVTRVEPFGAFVTLEPGVDGLIHVSKLQNGNEPEVGAEIDVIVDSVDTDNRRMSLGMVLTEVPVMYK